jgi:hypothetical protein
MRLIGRKMEIAIVAGLLAKGNMNVNARHRESFGR